MFSLSFVSLSCTSSLLCKLLVVLPACAPTINVAHNGDIAEQVPTTAAQDACPNVAPPVLFVLPLFVAQITNVAPNMGIVEQPPSIAAQDVSLNVLPPLPPLLAKLLLLVALLQDLDLADFPKFSHKMISMLCSPMQTMVQILGWLTNMLFSPTAT